MSEMKMLEELLQDIGCAYTTWEDDGARRLTVAQAHFFFDEAGRFEGVEADEMCTWYPRGAKP